LHNIALCRLESFAIIQLLYLMELIYISIDSVLVSFNNHYNSI
jgi:hypothetical protein